MEPQELKDFFEIGKHKAKNTFIVKLKNKKSLVVTLKLMLIYSKVNF